MCCIFFFSFSFFFLSLPPAPTRASQHHQELELNLDMATEYFDGTSSVDNFSPFATHKASTNKVPANKAPANGPGTKSKSEFRNYVDSARQEKVSNFYKLNHQNQTLQFVLETKNRISPLCSFQLSIWDAFKILSEVKDDSDPDTDNTQLIHGLQTAEALRRQYPDDDWLHLVGLIHDLGKVLTLPCFQLHQWAIVGDTFPVGCRFSDQNVFSDYFSLNADTNVPIYSTELGIYQANCGFMNVHMSYGHDEFLYQVLLNHYNKNSFEVQLPIQALYTIRFHSFYAWHKNGAYSYLANDFDHDMLKWVHALNRADLYSKDKEVPNFEDHKEYYQKLVDKYIPGILSW
jgi:inositol oxygenase